LAAEHRSFPVVKRRCVIKDTRWLAQQPWGEYISWIAACRIPRRWLALAVGLVAGATVFTLAGAQPLGKTTTHSFGLYAPADALPANVVVHGTNDLSRIPLAAEPIISDADIVSYDFTQHSMKLRPEALNRVSGLLLDKPNSAFVAVADGVPVYLGAFVKLDSLELCDLPTIIVDWQFEEQPADSVVVTWPFPPGSVSRAGPDPRGSERIKSVLTVLNKLQAQDVVYRDLVAKAFVVTNASPLKLARFLTRWLQEQSGVGPTNQTGSEVGGRGLPSGEVNGAQQISGNPGNRQVGRVLLVGDPRTRSVVVSAPPHLMVEMPKFIQGLDAQPYPESWPDGTLGQEQAKALAHQLANEKARAAYGVEPFEDGPEPTWVGRWVWGDVRSIGPVEIQALVSFGSNGSNRVASVSPFGNKQRDRGPSLGF
jgi:hypothetical protein